MFAIAVFLSYGLQFYIPMKIIGPWFQRFFKQNHQKLADGILRVSLVIVTCKTTTEETLPQISILIDIFYFFISQLF